MTFRNEDREQGQLEDSLRQNRPTPRQELIDRLVARVDRDAPTPRPARAPRHPGRFGSQRALAIGFATVFLAVFAGFGGLGYAKSVVTSATRGAHVTVAGPGGTSGSVGNGFKSSEKGDNGDDENDGGSWGGSAHHQYPHFVLVCFVHRTKEIPIIVPKRLANFLIDRGKAHLPPCATNHSR